MIEFKRFVESSTYLDPFRNFESFEAKSEIRWDPLTGLTARIMNFPARRLPRFDPAPLVAASLAVKCPFCEENAAAMTARLDPAMFDSEQVVDGDVRIIPNLLAFDKYSLVAIMCREHYLDMTALAAKGCVVKSIEALVRVFRKVWEKDASARYCSVNCNYMPMSGGSLIHPHVQGIAGEHPTNYQRLMIEKSAEFSAAEKAVFWDVLEEEEVRLGERAVGRTGSVFWYAPFAPKANMDIGCVFRAPSLNALDGTDWADFGEGFNKVLAYLDRENVGSFNLSIFSAPDDEDHFRVNGRIVARRFLPPVNAADVSYFEKLHMESACMVAPEDVAAGLREMW
jgi:galactose-1-phosphate uridylyltransferase